MIRLATPDDLPSITTIYNHYVRHSHATFDLEPFADRAEWFSHYGAAPFWVLVDDEVTGYATSSVFRTKPAYRSTVETSVYVAPEAVGRGIGRALYADLLARLDEAGVHRCVAGIALPNDASVALHSACGFRPVGTFTEVGFKGRWVDVAWYERAPPR
ncbi:MAG: family acetyltransferase [Frankiales bacterium]|nr:family acetyltransferase [Frankiales bacterium]